MKHKFLTIAIFFISFLSGILFFGALYFKFGLSIEQLLFVFAFPITGTNDAITAMIVKEVLVQVICPSALLAVFMVLLPKILHSKLAGKIYNLTQNLLREIMAKSIKFSLCVSVCLFILAFSFADSKLKFSAMIENHFFKPYSNFYEENYITPNASDFTKPKNARNLIVIIVESLESTFSAANIPPSAQRFTQNGFAQNGGGQNDSSQKLHYSPHGELIPNLTHFAQNGVNFSANSTLGGHLPNVGSSVTIQATISYLCGFPNIFPKGGIERAKGRYFSNATCIGNILDLLGYNQAVFTGADGGFGGYSQFIKNQHFSEFDVRYFRAQGYIPQDYRTAWGIEDAKLFSFAKKYLESYDKKEPFALYISTVDTHFPVFVDKAFCADLDLNYKNAFKCSDRIISDFVRFVQDSHFGKNTSIVIVGDHLSMERDFVPPNTKRYIYNAFINPRFSVNPSFELVKNRSLTHYDITALILDSLGFQVKAFGLGRNPLYGKTLIEEYGLENFNELITQPSKVYESFW